MESYCLDRLPKCTWTPNADDSPHTPRTKHSDRNKVLPDILHAIGQTPMVRLNNIPRSMGIKCEIFAKCEFFNPGGSVKDRIAYEMIQDAEEKGIIKPGYTIIEPTSGNTGIGLAMAAAVKGYNCIIVMPEKMSNEKVFTLQALGAKIVRTPTEVPTDSPESHCNVALKLQREIPNSVILDQYTNPGNSVAHYAQTANEIWSQCEGKVDYLVIGAGTGGTIAGVGRRFKEISPSTKIVGVDPKGSILALPRELNAGDCGIYEVEGIGYDFVPAVLDRTVVDIWYKTEDQESLNAARTLIREEGLLCGGSSGAALTVALRIAKDLPVDKRLVVLLPDGIRNYMTKFVSDQWMETKGFLESTCKSEANEWWWNIPVSDLTFSKPLFVKNQTTCQDAVALVQNKKDQALIVGDDACNKVHGAVTVGSLLASIASGVATFNDPVTKAINKQFAKITPSTKLGKLSRIIDKESYALVFDDTRDNNCLGVVTQCDLLHFISRNNDVSRINGGR